MATKSLDYQNLLMHLVKDFSWPNEYMFKFIVPFEPKLLRQLSKLFSPDAKLTYRESAEGKYISVTAIVLMDNPDDVIEIYKNAEEIERIIAL